MDLLLVDNTSHRQGITELYIHFYRDSSMASSTEPDANRALLLSQVDHVCDSAGTQDSYKGASQSCI